MRMTEMSRAERVVIPLEQKNLADAIWALAEVLSASGVLGEPESLRARIVEGRGEDLVAQSGRAYIAHYRTETALELGIAIRLAGAPDPRRSPGGGRRRRATVEPWQGGGRVVCRR